MPRLLTDEQVRTFAAESSAKLTQLIVGELPLSFPTDEASEKLREAIEHDLTVTLEGLMEPDEGEGQ
jgi:hypothetical protein